MRPSRQPCLLAFLLLASSLLAAATRAESLTITTSPPGATVEINGAVAGTTPYHIDYPSSYFHKPHTAFSARLEHAFTVRISKEGYLAQQVTLTNGPFEWVAVTGRHRGNYFLLKADHFEIKLEAISSGNGASSETYGNVGPMRPPTVTAEALRPGEQKNSSEGGSVAITSEPPDADIYIDGKFVGQTPSTIRLTAGSHHVEVRVQSRQTWERDLEVLKDSQLSLHATLRE
jgi:hypothetical protein